MNGTHSDLFQLLYNEIKTGEMIPTINLCWLYNKYYVQ